MEYNKQWANKLLRGAIRELKTAKTKHNKIQTINAIRIARNAQKWLTSHGFYWQTQRINNWIHYYMKPSALAENRSCVKAFLCQTCIWYFPVQKTCYNPNRQCNYKNDKGLNTKSEITKGCDC